MTFSLRNQVTREVTPLPPGVVTVGREDENDIFIDHISVSRRHARIINRDDGLYVEDLGSSNGTTVDGNSVQGISKLNVGDVVKFGAIEYQVQPEMLNDLGLPPAAIRRAPAQPIGSRDLRRSTEKLDNHPAVARLPSGPLPDPTLRERGTPGEAQPTSDTPSTPAQPIALKPPASGRMVAKSSTPFEASISNPMPANAAQLSRTSGRIPAPVGAPPTMARSSTPVEHPGGGTAVAAASSAPQAGGSIFVPLGYLARVNPNGLTFYPPDSPDLATSMAVTLVDSPNPSAPRRTGPVMPETKTTPLYLTLIFAFGAGIGLGVVLGIILYKTMLA